MSRHPHEVLVRAAWEAVAKSDVAAFEKVCREDLIWHASGRGARAGTYRGRQDVIDYLAAIGDAARRFDSRLDHVLTNEGLAAVLFHVTGERGDEILDTDFILIFRVEDDLLAEVWAVPRDQHAVDEFWA